MIACVAGTAIFGTDVGEVGKCFDESTVIKAFVAVTVKARLTAAMPRIAKGGLCIVIWGASIYYGSRFVQTDLSAHNLFNQGYEARMRQILQEGRMSLEEVKPAQVVRGVVPCPSTAVDNGFGRVYFFFKSRA